MGLEGGPSVQGLEDLYGPLWRQKHSEQVMYGRRKVIIDEIRRRQSQGISTGAAVEEIELTRQRGLLSLYQLYQLLNRQKKKYKKIKIIKKISAFGPRIYWWVIWGGW